MVAGLHRRVGDPAAASLNETSMGNECLFDRLAYLSGFAACKGRTDTHYTVSPWQSTLFQAGF